MKKKDKFYFDFKQIEKLVSISIKEDIGSGDITSNLLIPQHEDAIGKIFVEENAVLCGITVIEYVLSVLTPKIAFVSDYVDGAIVKKGNQIGYLEGNYRDILMAERLCLNFLQILSGTATLTKKYVDLIKGSGVKLVDTRKTIPGWRYLQKYAVRVGGGKNHRMGMYDRILVKDNHLKYLKSKGGIVFLNVIKEAFYFDKKHKTIDFEIEVEDTKDLNDVLNCRPDIIMLDNMTPSKVKNAIKRIRNFEKKTGATIDVEISGGINLNNIQRYIDTGIDYISVGALTHNVVPINYSLEIELQ